MRSGVWPTSGAAAGGRERPAKPGMIWRHKVLSTVTLATAAVLGVWTVFGVLWSMEPGRFDIEATRNAQLVGDGPPETGTTSVAALATIATTLLDKPGGYLSNDLVSPAVLLDNMPNWEFGVIVQIRDFARTLRNEFSRSQSQSTEDVDLSTADPKFSFDSESWIFPATESEYRDGIRGLESYLRRLQQKEARFFARADNLEAYLGLVSKRLGDLGQRLGASVGSEFVPERVPGSLKPAQPAAVPLVHLPQTPWMQRDDVFYEARGATWALLHILKALELDFRKVLADKNALISLQQVVRELERTQDAVTSPVILSGKGFGLFANHSLVLASYISRGNAAVIELRHLLHQG